MWCYVRLFWKDKSCIGVKQDSWIFHECQARIPKTFMSCVGSRSRKRKLPTTVQTTSLRTSKRSQDLRGSLLMDVGPFSSDDESNPLEQGRYTWSGPENMQEICRRLSISINGSNDLKHRLGTSEWLNTFLKSSGNMWREEVEKLSKELNDSSLHKEFHKLGLTMQYTSYMGFKKQWNFEVKKNSNRSIVLDWYFKGRWQVSMYPKTWQHSY